MAAKPHTLHLGWVTITALGLRKPVQDAPRGGPTPPKTTAHTHNWDVSPEPGEFTRGRGCPQRFADSRGCPTSRPLSPARREKHRATARQLAAVKTYAGAPNPQIPSFSEQSERGTTRAVALLPQTTTPALRNGLIWQPHTDCAVCTGRY